MLDTYRYRARKSGDVTAKLFDSKKNIPSDWHESPKAAKAAKLAELEAANQPLIETSVNDNSSGNNQHLS
jgi:hypothetical protein